MSQLESWLVSGRRVALAAALFAGGGCGFGPTAPSWEADLPFSATDVTVGTGDEAVAGKVVVVDYAGWLYNDDRPEDKGSLFDTSINRDVFPFQLGAGAVIPGWDQGVPGMRVGGQRRLIVPPNLAYGSTGSGPIPPNATLVFDIWLLGVFEPGQVPQATGPPLSRGVLE